MRGMKLLIGSWTCWWGNCKGMECWWLEYRKVSGSERMCGLQLMDIPFFTLEDPFQIAVMWQQFFFKKRLQYGERVVRGGRQLAQD